METTIGKDALLRTLEACRPGLAQREILEQSLCFVFDQGEVITYNDETSVRAPSGLPKDFKGAVAAKSLTDALQKVKQEVETVRVASDGDILQIAWKGGAIECALEADVRLPIGSVEPPGKWRKLHQDFADAVGLVQSCAGKDETQTALVCVHVAPDMVEACDNYQGCRWMLKTGFKESTLLKRSSVSTLHTLGVTEASESENWVHFRNARGVVLSCRRYAEDYPSDTMTPFLEAEGVELVLPKKLKEACELANVFSQEQSDLNLVQVTLKPGSPGKIIVRGQGVTGGAREALPINWSGPEGKFMISPTLLAEIAGRHNQVIVNDEVIKVQGGAYVYVTMLSKPEEYEEYRRGGKPKAKGEKDE